MQNVATTRYNLVRRGVILESNSCVMYGEKEETISHLLFNCMIAWRVWDMCYAWMSVALVNHYDAKSHFMPFCLPFLNEFSNKVYGNMWVAIIG